MDRTTDARHELIRRLLSQSVTTTRHLAIPAHRPGTGVPLTPAQAGIWFFTQLFPDSTEYNCFDNLRIPWACTEADLRRALRTLVERHDALRLRITVEDGEARQYDRPPFDPDVDWHDLRALPAEDAERRAEEIANAGAQVPLRVDRPPLFRVSAVALPGDAMLLVFVVHHIVNDYASMSTYMEELSALLAGAPLGPPPDVGFLDYAAWLDDTADKDRAVVELAYWKDKLGGDLAVLDLPADRPRGDEPSRSGHSVAVDLPPGLVGDLKDLATRNGTTLFVVLLAAYKVFLMRLTAQRDTVVGTALSGRDHPDAERIAGCFVKSVALRTDVVAAASFHDVIRAVHTTTAEAQDHQTVPFERIVDALGTPRRLTTHPVFQTFFGFQSDERLQLRGAQMNPLKLLEYGTAKWELSATLSETPQGVSGVMECSAALFDATTLDRFRGIWLHLSTALAADPEAAVGTHPLVTDAERQRILYGLNPHQPLDVPYATLAEPFEQQVARTPDAVAVEVGERTLTYSEFNAWANRLARALRGLGAGPGTRVALFMDRSVRTLAMVYAVAKSGAAYVPLDPQLPDARLAFMLQDTAPQLVVAEADGTGRMPVGTWAVHTFADLDAAAANEADGDLPARGDCHNVSHLLYTSGSTGKPKAVICPVATAVADILEMQRHLAYRPDDVMLFKTSYGFDTSLWEILWPLYVGARVVVCPPGAEKDPEHLVEVVERHAVTTVYLTPTLLQAVVDHIEDPGRWRAVRYLHTGGEVVTPGLRDAFYAKFAALGTELINGYGPTETACMVSTRLADTPGDPVVPLGRPHRHYRMYVLDEELNVVPVNVPGEAYLSSPIGISHGYHHRPELTAQRFLPDPYGPPGSRMYRTGDLCCYRPDGTVTFLERLDTQVKIRGNRIELAEVEAVLRLHPDVADCVVVTVGEGVDRALAAFVRTAGDARFDAAALLDHARGALPQTMVPAGVQAIESIPVNVNGKTDRRALQRAWLGETLPRTTPRVPPANEVERQLAHSYAEALGLAEVGVTDSFFDLGGHSLKIFKLIAVCARRLGVRLRVADVFEAPTVRRLAERLDFTHSAPETSLVPLVPRPGRPLVVFVHATSGSALPFHAVARALGDDFSVLGLQSPDGEAEHTVESLAARYVEAVDGVRGLSPVLLAGWSMGGCIALEMARAWHKRGEDVTGTVLLDTWVPPDGRRLDPAERAAARAALLDLDIIATEGLDTAIGDEAPDELARLRRAIERNRGAYLDYTPHPYDGPVHLLRAAETGASPDPYAVLRQGPDHGWGEVLPDVVTQTVPGNHFTLLDEHHAPRLAAVLTAIAEAGLSFTEI